MQNFWNQFKTPIVTIATFFVLLLIYTKIFGPIPFYVNNVNTTKTDLFSASGNAEVTAAPDQAIVYAGVTKQAATVEDAQKQVNTVANKLINDLKAQGIKEVDIKTTNYSVNPNYNGGADLSFPTRPSANGFEVTQNLEISVKISEVNKITDLVTKDGANLVSSANFTFSKELQEKLEKEATEKAVTKAKNQAQFLANSAGIKLGRIINVVSSGTNPQPIFMSAQKSEPSLDSTSITPGQNKVNVGVTIYYETY